MKIFELSAKPGDPVLIEPRWIAMCNEFLPGQGRFVDCFSSLSRAELFCNLHVRGIYCSAKDIESFFVIKAERLADPTLTTEQIAEIFLGTQREAQNA